MLWGNWYQDVVGEVRVEDLFFFKLCRLLFVETVFGGFLGLFVLVETVFICFWLLLVLRVVAFLSNTAFNARTHYKTTI